MTQAIWILAVLLSHWRRHPMQLTTLLIGLISATALWSGVQALNQQARDSYDRAAATFGGARTATLVSRSGPTFSQKLFVDLRRAGWRVSPVLEGRIQIGGRSFRLLGIEPLTLPAEVGNAPTIGRAGLQSFLTPPGETLVAPEVLSDLSLPEGATPLAGDGTPLPPLHVQAQLVPDVLVVDIGIAQRLLKMPDQLSRLLVGKAKGTRAPLESIVGGKLRLIEPDAESDLERLTDSFHLNLTAFGLLSFVVGLFIVNSAVGLAFEQRLPMLRTLRACGVSARMLNTVLVAELVSLALIAGLVGLICGYLIAASLLPDVAASLRGLYGAQIPGQLTLKSEWWIAGIIISVAGALAGRDHESFESGPASGAGRRAALCLATGAAPMADSPERAGARCARRRGLLPVVRRFACFGICRAGGVAAWRGARIAGDPRTRAFIGQRRAHRALAVWFWADSRQQLSGLSLALMALLLALAVNVGVGTMVETFSRTFVSWLDGRLVADIYINASDTAQATAIKAWLGERSEVEAILPGGRTETQINGAPIEILGLPDHATYREHWPLLQSAANAWISLRPGDAGFISEQLARRLNLAIGDRIEVPAPGGDWTLEVVGIYADYGNPRGQIAVNIAALIRRFPAIPQTRLGLRVAPAAVPALIAALRDKFGLDRSNLLDQATVKTELKRIFNRTFAITAALNAFTLGVAGVALLTSLLTLSNSRLPQLAPLWAIGDHAAAACGD